jgi:hypothetical protein
MEDPFEKGKLKEKLDKLTNKWSIIKI